MRYVIPFAVWLCAADVVPQEYRCTYTKKVECSNGDCRITPIGTAYLLIPDPDSLLVRTTANSVFSEPPPQIRRCDEKGCSAFDVTAALSGIFVNVSTRGGYYLKIATADVGELKKGMFVESATLFLSTVNYWGICRLP